MDNLRVRTILGIDPGYDRVGWCVGKKQNGNITIEKYGSVLTKKTDSLFERYHQIDTELQKVVDEFHPEECAVESLFFSKNQKTALHVSEARGVILSVLFRNHIAFFEYTPLQIKQAVTGYGKADKAAVEKMLRLQFQFKNGKILDDVVDAVGVMVTHAGSILPLQKGVNNT